MEITVGAESRPGPAECFTGTVWFEQVAAPSAPSRLRAYNVRFAPGARTAWHRHPLGQVLYVTDGAGLVGREGGPVQEIRAGDAVWIAPGERHWHGAGPHTFMTHLAVLETAEDGSETEWGAHVGDAEYAR